jgi:hypothetical protein
VRRRVNRDPHFVKVADSLHRQTRRPSGLLAGGDAKIEMVAAETPAIPRPTPVIPKNE